MKRVLSVVFSFAITLCCLSPALATESAGFSDVSQEDWFAPYVEVCVEKGLMQGTGEGKFEPERVLTCAESATLAARLGQLGEAGQAAFLPAPEAWGQLTLTLEDGAEFFFFSPEFRLNPIPMSAVLLIRPGETKAPDLRDWEEGSQHEVTVTAGECAPVAGTASWYGGGLHFHPAEYDEDYYAMLDWVGAYQTLPGPGDWFRDAAYCLEAHGLLTQRPFEFQYAGRESQASRQGFVLDLNRTVGGLVERLEAVNSISTFPDASAFTSDQKAAILAFYNAGILTGVDGEGTFSGEGTLTRAEAAAMAARIVEPSLRIALAPEEDAGVTPFEEDGLYGLKDAAGTVRIPAQYAYLVVEEDGAVIVTDQKGNKGILDAEGNVVLPCLYPRIYNSPDEEGLVVVGSAGDYASPLHYNGKKGMINTQGDVVIPLEYDFLTPFENGQASFLRRSGGEMVFGHLRPDGAELPLTAEEVTQDDPLYMALYMLGLMGSQE